MILLYVSPNTVFALLLTNTVRIDGKYFFP